MKKEPVCHLTGREDRVCSKSILTPSPRPRRRRIRTWQIAVYALMIVEAAVMAIAANPIYWAGAGLLALLCAGQLFDRRPERHTVAGVVLYGVIAVLIGIFVAEQLL